MKRYAKGVLLLVLALAVQASAQTFRPFTISDLLKVRRVGDPQLSPDGKWIAYSSNSTGRSEIYIQPYPQGTKIQVSLNGGVFPRWGNGGKEIYFMSLLSAGNLMMSNIRVMGAMTKRFLVSKPSMRPGVNSVTSAIESLRVVVGST